jgi:hypothetical protein
MYVNTLMDLLAIILGPAGYSVILEDRFVF